MMDDKTIPVHLRDLAAMIQNPEAILKIGSIEHFTRQQGKSEFSRWLRLYCEDQGIPLYTPAPGIEGRELSFIIEDELSSVQRRADVEPSPLDAWWRG